MSPPTPSLENSPSDSDSGGFGGFLRRNSDLPLVLGVIVILSLLVFRIPPAAMDYFLATNIGVSLTILLIALYIPSPIKLPSFPTILLLATLFRLALNVGTTRLILLDANAGSIIDTFGRIVVGGNFVVGAVVFLVLVIVQFVVIAKGSERVAEVAARFTLDAMPGKQMSIDADLRAGLIDPAGAKRRRQELERESKLYGAMDGAMKFVKGDAIAGIIISIVNIVGGLIIGVAQVGMSVSEAGQVYSLLTIGDGLVSQIPALLISVAAGIVVTRVAASDRAEGDNLGSEMLEQIMENSKGLLVAGALLFAVAILSVISGIGLQPIPFVALGGILMALGFVGGRKEPEEAARAAGRPRPPGEAGAEAPRPAPVSFAPAPLTLKIHPSLAPLLASKEPGLRKEQLEHMRRSRERRNRDLGMVFPPMGIQVDPQGLQQFEYTVLANDTPIATGRCPINQVFAMAPPKELAAHGIQAKPYVYPGTRLTIGLIDSDGMDAIQADEKLRRRVPLKRSDQSVFEHVDIVCRRRADLFFGIQQTQDLIDALERRSDALVKAVIPRVMTAPSITEVLRMLLQEEVPIRDLSQIFESFSRWGEKEKEPARLVELIRRDLGPALCHLYSGGASRLRFYGLAPDLEDLFAQGTLNPTERAEVIKLFARSIRPEAHIGAPPVVVVNNSQIRRAVWWVMKDRLPDLRVLSRESTTGFATEAITHLSLIEKPAETPAT